MEFRPCIDIHNGKVKQIVGSSLRDAGDKADTNFVSDKDAGWYANLYRRDQITGAHVIMLNSPDSEYRDATEAETMKALAAYPGGLQVGGGINADNAGRFIEAGASHVIVTSYVFAGGKVNYDNLTKLQEGVGANRVVLDLSCRKKNEDGKYYIVTDRWQKFTDEAVTAELFSKLSTYCDEFLVHGVDVEGKGQGVDGGLIEILAQAAREKNLTITYAGGISSVEDIELIANLSDGKLNFTVGSKLDIYGGTLKYDELAHYGR